MLEFYYLKVVSRPRRSWTTAFCSSVLIISFLRLFPQSDCGQVFSFFLREWNIITNNHLVRIWLSGVWKLEKGCWRKGFTFYPHALATYLIASDNSKICAHYAEALPLNWGNCNSDCSRNLSSILVYFWDIDRSLILLVYFIFKYPDVCILCFLNVKDVEGTFHQLHLCFQYS